MKKMLGYYALLCLVLGFVCKGGSAQVMSADTLIGEFEGYTVVDQTGKEIGDISDIMLNVQTGQIAYVVLSYGGLFGIGAELIAVPWDAFQLNRNEKHMVLRIPKIELRNAPRFREEDKDNLLKEEWSQQNDQYYEELRLKFYAVTPAGAAPGSATSGASVTGQTQPVQTPTLPQQAAQARQQGDKTIIPVINANGALEVTYTGPDQAKVGEMAQFSIKVENTSEQPVENIIIVQNAAGYEILSASVADQSGQQTPINADVSQQQQPQQQQPQQQQVQQQPQQQQQDQGQSQPQQVVNAQSKQWVLGTLESKQSKTLQITGTPEKEGDMNLCLSVDFDQPQICKTVKAVQPELFFARQIVNQNKEKVTQAYVCEPLFIYYQLKNTGTGTTEAAVIREQLPQGLQAQNGQSQIELKSGPLASGQAFDQLVPIQAQQALVLDNRAQATAGNISVTSLRQEVILIQPQLELEANVPDRVNILDPVTVDFMVRNAGQHPVLNAQVNIDAPQAASMVVYAGPQNQAMNADLSQQNRPQGQQPQPAQQQTRQQQGQQQQAQQQQAQRSGQGQPQGEPIQGNSITIERLEAGESRHYTAVLQPQQVGALNGAVTAAGHCVNPLKKDFSLEVFGFPELEIVKSVVNQEGKAVEEIYACEPLMVRYQVRNTGPVPAENVVIQEPLPQGLQTDQGNQNVEISVGTLAPNQTVEKTVALQAQQHLEYQQSATAVSETRSATSDVAGVVILKPQVSMQINGPEQARVNDRIVYNVTVLNESPAPVRDAQIQLQVPNTVSNVQVSNRNLQIQGNTLIIGQIAGNSSANFDLVMVPTQPGQVNGSFVLNGYCLPEQQQNVSTQVVGIPALRIEMVDVKDPVPVNENTVYEIRVKNQGTAQDMNVQLQVLLPPQLQFVSGEGDTQVQQQGDRLVFGPLQNLDPDAVASWRITVQAREPGQFRTTLEVTSDANQQPVSETEPTTVQ